MDMLALGVHGHDDVNYAGCKLTLNNKQLLLLCAQP